MEISGCIRLCNYKAKAKHAKANTLARPPDPHGMCKTLGQHHSNRQNGGRCLAPGARTCLGCRVQWLQAPRCNGCKLLGAPGAICHKLPGAMLQHCQVRAGCKPGAHLQQLGAQIVPRCKPGAMHPACTQFAPSLHPVAPSAHLNAPKCI